MTSQHGTTSPVYTSHCQSIHPTGDAKCDMIYNIILNNIINCVSSCSLCVVMIVTYDYDDGNFNRYRLIIECVVLI